MKIHDTDTSRRAEIKPGKTKPGKTKLGKIRAPAFHPAMSQYTDPSTASLQSLVGRAEAFCKEGDNLFNECDWEGATDRYRAAVALGSDHSEVWALLVGALYRRAHARPDVPSYMDETLAACEETLHRDPDCPVAAHYLARTLQDLGRQEEAYRLHEKTALQRLKYGLRALAQEVAMQKRSRSGDRDLTTSLLVLDTLLLQAFRLFSAYAQERQGEPIEWDELSDPIDPDDPDDPIDAPTRDLKN